MTHLHNTGTVPKSGSEQDICVGKESLFEGDNDELLLGDDQ